MVSFNSLQLVTGTESTVKCWLRFWINISDKCAGKSSLAKAGFSVKWTWRSTFEAAAFNRKDRALHRKSKFKYFDRACRPVVITFFFFLGGAKMCNLRLILTFRFVPGFGILVTNCIFADPRRRCSTATQLCFLSDRHLFRVNTWMKSWDGCFILSLPITRLEERCGPSKTLLFILRNQSWIQLPDPPKFFPHSCGQMRTDCKKEVLTRCVALTLRATWLNCCWPLSTFTLIEVRFWARLLLERT